VTVELPLGALPRRLFPCTPSRLAAYSDCPRRYRLRYLDRPAPRKGPPWAHAAVGASVHAALRTWWDEPLAARTPATAAALLERGWLTDGFRDRAQGEAARALALGWVRRYVASLDPVAEPLAVERTVAARTDALALSGRVDRLDDRDGELVVVDYKTGRRPPVVDDARGSPALALYAVAASRTLRRPCRRVELHHLPTGQVTAWRHSDEALGRHVRRAEDVAEDVVRATARLRAGTDPDGAFPAVPSRSCGWCDYLRDCPDGRVVATPMPSWAGLAPEVAA